MEIEKYNEIEHFINDQSFINWVHNNELSDIEFWDKWLLNHPEKRDLVFDAKDIVIGIKFNKNVLSDEKIQNEWVKLKNNIISAEENSKFSWLRFNKIQHFAVAASVVIVISMLSFLYFNQSTDIIHKTAFGEIINLKLSDGTKVVLNSNSILSYNEKNPRLVKLNGEAFFEVARELATNSKFNVITKDLEIQVFGTEFNVNSRNAKTRVFLKEGKVDLKLKNGLSKKMIPGDLISYSYKTNQLLEEKNSLKPEIQTSWKDGSLIFENVTIEEAFLRIEETYGVKAIFEDKSLKNILLTGAIPTSNLDIALKTIEKSAQLTIVSENNELYIRKN